MTMEGAKEFIVYPHPKEITTLPVQAVVPFLEQLWNRSSERAAPDFDRLFGAGQLARLLGIPAVESRLREWLTAHNDLKKWDVAGCFLMGFWRGARTAEGQLVELLVSALEKLNLSSGARDSAVCALAAAHDQVAPAAAGRIESCFRQLLQRSDIHEYQPTVASALKYVLHIPG